MRLIALPEGTYTVGLDKVFIPFNPKTDSIKDRPASLLVEIQPFLLNTTHDIILCDTGLGYTDTLGELILHKNIKSHGIMPEQITKVLFGTNFYIKFNFTIFCTYFYGISWLNHFQNNL